MAQSGDRKEAFRCLYQAYYRPIVAYTRRRLDPQEADDVVAEVFLVAWRRLDDIPTGDSALAWLYGVARRVLSQNRRSGRRRERLVARLTRLVRIDEGFSAEMDRMDQYQAVGVALARLRPTDQELLRLAEWEELTPLELARVFKCSPNAIAIRLHRAHKRFRQALLSLEEEGTGVTLREAT